MGGFAKVTCIGNLGRDPEVRFSAGGTAVANLNVACTERVKQKDGQWGDHTEWVRVVCFGKTAENAGQYLQKGRQVYAEGRLQTREWTDKDGNKRTSTEVLASQVLFLGNGNGSGGAPTARRGGGTSAPSPNDPPPLTDDDIPF